MRATWGDDLVDESCLAAARGRLRAHAGRAGGGGDDDDGARASLALGSSGSSVDCARASTTAHVSIGIAAAAAAAALESCYFAALRDAPTNTRTTCPLTQRTPLLFRPFQKNRYEGPGSSNPLAFRYYNAEEVIMGKPMKEWCVAVLQCCLLLAKLT